MTEQDIEAFKTVLSHHWPPSSSEKVRRYIGKFYERKRIGTKIVAGLKGKHGTYTVSIRVDGQTTTSACSCYIGKRGYCHHCAALAATFLNDPGSFRNENLSTDPIPISCCKFRWESYLITIPYRDRTQGAGAGAGCSRSP